MGVLDEHRLSQDYYYDSLLKQDYEKINRHMWVFMRLHVYIYIYVRVLVYSEKKYICTEARECV